MGKRNEKSDWLIKPNSYSAKDQLVDAIDELIEDYASRNPEYYNLHLNDNNQRLYFLSFPDETSELSHAEVAFLDEGDLVFLPDNVALDTARSYIYYLTMLDNAYRSLRELREE